jgi:hypothetical protein
MKRPRTDSISEFTRLTIKNLLSFVEQDHCLTKLGLVQVGGAPNNSNTIGHQFLDYLPEIVPRDWINANAWLVE